MEVPDDEQIIRAFRACPKLDKTAAESLCPEVVEVATMVADCLAVSWEWTALAMLTIAGSTIPEDRIEPAPSISLPSSLWIVMMHPGATNSSGVIAVTSKAITKMLAANHKSEEEKAKEEWQALPEEDRSKKFVAPTKRQILAGGVSLAANGIQMSLGRNRNAALSVECEVDSILRWFGEEAGVDAGVPGKLWDGVEWNRPVMDKNRAFSVASPWFGILCAGHVPEVFKAMRADTFGLRERLTVSFAEPSFCTMASLRSACNALPVKRKKPEDFLATLFLPLLQWF